MKEISIKPNTRLKTKLFFILLTISFFILLIGLLLQLLVPLDPKVESGKLAVILWPITGGVVFLMWLIAAPLIEVWFKNLSYTITKERIIIKKGILTRIQQNIPYRAITDFQLHRSLYDRFLKIASIRIQTAGQSYTATGYEGNLAGLTEWDSLLDAVHRLIAEYKGEAPPEDKTIPEAKDEVLREILRELKSIKDFIVNK